MSESAQVLGSGVTDETIPIRRRLRVCHLAYTFYENDNRVRRYAEALADEGDDVEILALRRKGQARSERAGGVQLLRIQQRVVTEQHPLSYLLKILLFFFRSAVVLATRHIRDPYDVVHVHNVPDFLVFAAIVPKFMGARIILDIHDILPEFYVGKFGSGRHSIMFRVLLWVETVSCRFADHVMVANDLWHDKLVTRATDNAKCTTMLNYPDLRLFRPLPPGHRRLCRKFVMLYPGTLNHHQGLDIAVRAFGLAKDRMPEAELHIYGEGPARADLLNLAEQCSLSDRIRVLNRLPLEEIALVMATADLGIVPKRADGFGNEAFSTKTLEFMACCVPVVLARTKVDEHYFDDTLVHFFTPGSESELSQLMLQIYGTRPAIPERVRAARQFVVQNSWQQRAHEYLTIVNKLTNTADRTALAK